MRSLAPWALVTLIGITASGCNGDPGRVSWRIELDPSVDAAEVRSMEAHIAPNACARDRAVFRTAVRTGETSPIAPDPLPEGRWGFGALAVDSACRVIAEGCETVSLPSGDDLTVTTVLSPVSPRDLCPGRCSDGLCAPTPDSGTDGGRDAGPIDAAHDAGGREAGPLDAGRDAGPIDAGHDAGRDACIPATEICDNGVDDDCDGDADCDDTACDSARRCLPCMGVCTSCQTCVSNVCQPMPEGTSCNSGAGICRGGGLCCEGCWVESSEVCATGSTLQCGVGGALCVQCTGAQTCVSGVCT